MIAATQTRAMHSTITPATRKVVSSRLAGFQVSCLNVIVRLCDCLCVCVWLGLCCTPLLVALSFKTDYLNHAIH